jgi:ubiquinone/menaquinone biosynthesis C-methylase UbiE
MFLCKSRTAAKKSEPASLDAWLATLPVRGEYPCISEPRRFQHEESEYDAQYGNELADLSCGRGLVNFVRQHKVDMTGPAIEIGCGTGRMSLGLVHQRAFPTVLLTDPSPAFVDITAEKLRRAQIRTDRVRFGLLMGEDTDRLPTSTFSLIVLRSTLHHILDVDRFIQHTARALQPGGALVFQEPCMEGYVLMGAMAQFMPALCTAADRSLNDEQRRQLDLFIRTMHFYARRDMNKSKAEDKHLFRVDELMATASKAGLALSFQPNMTFEHFADGSKDRPAPDGFRNFFHAYLKYCMSFDDQLMELFDEHIGPYCDWLDSLCAAGSPPYLHGVFFARRE